MRLEQGRSPIMMASSIRAHTSVPLVPLVLLQLPRLLLPGPMATPAAAAASASCSSTSVSCALDSPYLGGGEGLECEAKWWGKAAR
jgi:hypothetical protein